MIIYYIKRAPKTINFPFENHDRHRFYWHRGSAFYFDNTSIGYLFHDVLHTQYMAFVRYRKNHTKNE